MSPTVIRDWVDLVIAAGLVILSVDRWIHGRNIADIQQTNFNQRIEERVDRLEKKWENTSQRTHELANSLNVAMGTMATNLNILTTEVKVAGTEIKNIYHLLGDVKDRLAEEDRK